MSRRAGHDHGAGSGPEAILLQADHRHFSPCGSALPANVSVYPLIVVDNQQADKGFSTMKDNEDDFLPGEISPAGLARIARVRELTPLVTFATVHDGSPTSLEFARIEVGILDDILDTVNFMLAHSRHPSLSIREKERLEAHRAKLLGQRTKAQWSVDLNLERSLKVIPKALGAA